MNASQSQLYLVNAYRMGVSISEIAEELGVHRSTIHRRLEACGEAPTRNTGRAETCVRMHSKADAIETQPGTWRCRTCKRESDRRRLKQG